jgi:hypothetical protein
MVRPPEKSKWLELVTKLATMCAAFIQLMMELVKWWRL